MQPDTVDVIFTKGRPDYLKAKTEPNALETAITPGEQCKNEPNDSGAPRTASHEPPATSGRQAPKLSRAEAARENDRQSRGPKTREGKVRSSQYALEHGLTASRVSINSEEDDEWESFLAACREELQPVGVSGLSYAGDRALTNLLEPKRLCQNEPDDPVIASGGESSAPNEPKPRPSAFCLRHSEAKRTQASGHNPAVPPPSAFGLRHSEAKRTQASGHTPPFPCLQPSAFGILKPNEPKPPAPFHEPQATSAAKPPFGLLHSSVAATTDSCSSPSV
jgi:hypothetical protein